MDTPKANPISDRSWYTLTFIHVGKYSLSVPNGILRGPGGRVRGLVMCRTCTVEDHSERVIM